MNDPVVIVSAPEVLATSRLSALELAVVEYELDEYDGMVHGVAMTQSAGRIILNYGYPEDTFQLMYDIREHVVEAISGEDEVSFILFEYEPTEVIAEGERKKRIAA